MRGWTFVEAVPGLFVELSGLVVVMRDGIGRSKVIVGPVVVARDVAAPELVAELEAASARAVEIDPDEAERREERRHRRAAFVAYARALAGVMTRDNAARDAGVSALHAAAEKLARLDGTEAPPPPPAPAAGADPTCGHGFGGPCAECDGAGQSPGGASC